MNELATPTQHPTGIWQARAAALTGHRSPITSIDVSGSSCCTGGYDGRVLLWRSNSPEWMFQCPDLVNSVAFDDRRDRVAAACADGWVYVLCAADGSLATKLGPHGDDVEALAWSPNGSGTLSVVCNSSDPCIHTWDVPGARRIRRIEGHEGRGVMGISYDRSSARMATASEDGTVRIWGADGSALGVLRHPADPETVDWSPDGRYVVSGADDGVLRLWDPVSGEIVGTSNASRGALRLVRFSRRGDVVLSGSYDGCIRIHRAVPELPVLRALSAAFQWERAADFTDDGIVVGSFGSHPIFHTFDGKPTEAHRTYGINFITARDEADSDEEAVVAVRDDGAVIDVCAERVLHFHDSIVNGAAFSPDGRLLASVDYLGGIVLYDRRALDVVARHRLDTGPLNACVWSPDGAVLATSGYDGTIRYWTRDLSPLGTVEAHDGPIKSLSYSPVTGVLVAGSSDDGVSAWRGSERVFRSYVEGVRLVNCVCASPAAPRFASVSRDGNVRVWSCETGEILEVLPAVHVKSVKSVAYDATGRSLISGSYDARAVLHTPLSGGGWRQCVLEGHAKPGVPSVAFSRTAAWSAGWDGSVIQWSPAGEQLRRIDLELCSTVSS